MRDTDLVKTDEAARMLGFVNDAGETDREETIRYLERKGALLVKRGRAVMVMRKDAIAALDCRRCGGSLSTDSNGVPFCAHCRHSEDIKQLARSGAIRNTKAFNRLERDQAERGEVTFS
jgi:hypothetical protein